jgi:hypothetical protein
MADQAKLRSVEALEELRRALVIFLEKAARAYDGVSDDLKRTRGWLEVEQRNHWEMVLKKRRRMRDQAEAELTTARFSDFIDAPTTQQMQLRRARAAVQEAEAKVARIKRWIREFEPQSEAAHRGLCSIRFGMEADLRRAVAWLSAAQDVLLDYTTSPSEGSAALALAREGGARPTAEEMLATLPTWDHPEEPEAAPYDESGQTQL